ncbi:hypothetical protein [Paraburkholderia sp. RAU2J]|uniref:hypothetical protein n=1 Tax=Paraburkholderia sp. RAU2J TaxID=1938810 RepID=UPI0011C37865|nr:hypothetical protein [Paraburkholderia sp. RAU2J]
MLIAPAIHVHFQIARVDQLAPAGGFGRPQRCASRRCTALSSPHRFGLFARLGLHTASLVSLVHFLRSPRLLVDPRAERTGKADQD